MRSGSGANGMVRRPMPRPSSTTCCWPEVQANALEPGWVATRMGGPGATDDLDQAHRTQAWLAAGVDPATRVTGRYFYHAQQKEALAAAHDVPLQDALLALCARLSGVAFPR